MFLTSITDDIFRHCRTRVAFNYYLSLINRFHHHRHTHTPIATFIIIIIIQHQDDRHHRHRRHHHPVALFQFTRLPYLPHHIIHSKRYLSISHPQLYCTVKTSFRFFRFLYLLLETHCHPGIVASPTSTAAPVRSALHTISDVQMLHLEPVRHPNPSLAQPNPIA